MVNAFLAVVFMMVSFSLFYVSTSINMVNRAVLFFPIEIIQNSVNILDADDGEDLYFNRQEMEMEVQSYFDRAIKNYVVSYQPSIIFTNDDNTMICMGPNSKCRGVKIGVQAELYFDIHYEKTMFYSIGES